MVPQIARLTHVGLHVTDLDASVAFYRDVLGLEVTDDDREHGIVFLSSHPDDEHHEVLLTGGRNAPADVRLVQQIAFRCPTLEDVVRFWRRFEERGVRILYTVSHGNAISCYFFDPDGNVCEVYWPTGLRARQGFLAEVDLSQPPEQVIERVLGLVEEHGESGYVDSALLERQGIDS